MPVRRYVVPVAAALLFLRLASATAEAAGSGRLDPTFGKNGKVTTALSGVSDIFAVIQQADGKIVAAGTVCQPSAACDVAVVRYLPDGRLDHSFGRSGTVTTDFAGGTDAGAALAIQSDGDLVVAGTAQVRGKDEFGLARYGSDGRLDPAFGRGGKVTTHFPGHGAQAAAVLVQPDGEIVVAGTTETTFVSSDFALARYQPDGSLDTTFGVGGRVRTDFTGMEDEVSAAALQPDGRIVVAGATFDITNGATADFALARYQPDGSLDPSFGSAGRVRTDFAGTSDQALAVAIQLDGRIIAAGRTETRSVFSDFALIRYRPGGRLDRSFGTGGKVETDFNVTDDFAFGVAVEADGKIVAAGLTDPLNGAGSEDFALARYTSVGTLDGGFGKNGRVTTDFGGDDEARAMLVQADGKIVAGGLDNPNPDGSADRFAIARYLG